MDGKLSFRVKGTRPQRKDYANALPVFSVDTVQEAMHLILQVSVCGWVAGAPELLFVGSKGEYDDLVHCTSACEAAYRTMTKEREVRRGQ